MVYVIIFGILTAIMGIALIGIIVNAVLTIVAALLGRSIKRPLRRLTKAVISFTVALMLNIGLISVSQSRAYTPKINGLNSVAELTRVELNGRKQWISIRGKDKNNPVLLFLAGGPGGTQMAAVRRELAELEDHFVVVNWDQPGSGKSYGAQRGADMTAETYIEDGHALTEYLKERFGQEKIYLIGESWGSALGIFLIARYPESYHAFIGTGQMVDFAETERIDYHKALEIAESRGDKNIVKSLKHNGEAPYYGRDMVWKSAVYLNYLTAYMSSLPEVHDPGYKTLDDAMSEEYGLLDKINFFRGIAFTFNEVYQTLYGIDLRKDYAKLDVPVCFFTGRYDYNAPTSLVEEYVEVLDAPEKEIVWFEHSAHSPWINESDKFVDEVINRFLGD